MSRLRRSIVAAIAFRPEADDGHDASLAQTIDGLVVVSSEAGIANLAPASIKRLHRLGVYNVHVRTGVRPTFVTLLAKHTIPKTSSGKVQRHLTRRRFGKADRP